MTRSVGAVATGSRVGPYEVVGWLGAGGMGEVYRARDPRLGRDVAIKLILEAKATNADVLVRFEQEARAAGQLNHPNLPAVFDVGVHDGTPYIVSELLEGESLRRRLQRGALPTRKAIDYARQVADGLAAAHDKGIVHRDVKPDNVFITSADRIKLLDFGIAKLTRPVGATAAVGSVTDTLADIVVGTAGYMSPEQVRGESVDSRSDIFSVGTMLHEMLTGRPAFMRATSVESMSAVLNEDPSVPLPSDTPMALVRIVSRCLEKSQEARFQSARDLAFGLEDVSAVTQTPPDAAAVMARRRSTWHASVAAVAVAAAALAAAWAFRPSARPEQVPPASFRLSVELGGDVSLAPANLSFGDAAAVSRDGTTIAFVAQKEAAERARIYVRRLTALHATPLPGTEDAVIPFFAPDGQRIGFFAGGKLKTIAATGGAVMTLADAPDPRGGWWGEDGRIVFSPARTAGTRLQRVPAAGGPTEVLTALAEGEAIQVWPQVLPGGHAVLYTSSTIVGAYNDADLVVQMLPSGARKVVQRGGYHGRYAPSGHLVYLHEGTLFAVPFDLDRFEVAGQPVRAVEGVMSNAITGGAQFSLPDTGTLVYLSGQSAGGSLQLNWMDVDGQLTPLRATPTNWFNPLFSPDGRRLAMEIRSESFDIWVYDWEKDTNARLTSNLAQDTRPVWSPDGAGIVFASARADRSAPNLYWKRADGVGDDVRLTTSTNIQQPSSWHPSGRFLTFDETTEQANIDVMVLPLEGNFTSGWRAGTPSAFVNSPSVESHATFSPDGRWIAYASNESGRSEVYVRPFPGPGGKWQVSVGGGTHPTWSRAGPGLFYGRFGEIFVARYAANDDSFSAEKPRLWSRGRYQPRGTNRMFDVHPDGTRAALAPAETAEVEGQSTAILIFNFMEELRRLAPVPR